MSKFDKFKRYRMRLLEEYRIEKALKKSVDFITGIYRPWMGILYDMNQNLESYDVGPEYLAVLDELCDDIGYYQDVALFLLGQPIDLERSRKQIYGIS